MSTPIVGYRQLTEREIELINAIKAHGSAFELLLEEVKIHINGQSNSDPHRWHAIAKTDMQTGLMALARAVAQPTNF